MLIDYCFLMDQAEDHKILIIKHFILVLFFLQTCVNIYTTNNTTYLLNKFINYR